MTGANGFVGRAVCRRLKESGCHVVAAVRDESVTVDAPETRYIGDLADDHPLDPYMKDVDAIVHLAARVHVMSEQSIGPEHAYHQVNVMATKRLAEAAIRQGVKRFVLLSSIKVNGEKTGQAPFVEDDKPNPLDAYGRSKWEAEQVLTELAAPDRLELVILRVPLVYGPAVKANFLSLLRLCDSPVPLPFGAITENRRSMIFVENLADAIRAAVFHPKAVGQTFLVSDGMPVSTAALVGSLKAALGRRACLLPVPLSLLRLILASVGKSAAADRLAGSLAIDGRRIREKLDWAPPATFEEGIAATVAWYRESG